MTAPIRLAILNDHALVVAGLARMLEPYGDRVQVVDVSAGGDLDSFGPIDIVLYDASAARARDEEWPDLTGAGWQMPRIVLFSWDDSARALPAEISGSDGSEAVHLSKSVGNALTLLTALEEIHATRRIGQARSVGCDSVPTHRQWPGKEHGLTERESEIIALILEGLSNQALADRLFLSVNTVKSYIRTAYQTMQVTTRSQAVLWGIDHGLRRAANA